MKMKAYKGFDKNLQCKGHQYEVGKEYAEEKADLCSSGFHACENPLNVFDYYSPATSRYCEVELDDITDQHDGDTKRVGKKIKIGAEIGIPGLVKAFVEYTKAHTTSEHIDPKQATAGDSGAATSRGSVSVGANGSGLVRGNGIKARGGLGAILVICVEMEDSYDIADWRAVRVDGKTIKADTWYTLKDGQLIETEE